LERGGRWKSGAAPASLNCKVTASRSVKIAAGASETKVRLSDQHRIWIPSPLKVEAGVGRKESCGGRNGAAGKDTSRCN
jgi:hypothetical protein